MSAEVLGEALVRLGAGEVVALATVVGTRGSTPQKIGARLLVRGDGTTLGTLGGGAVEADAAGVAGRQLDTGGTVLREYTLATGTDEWGLACGGTMVVFAERLGSGAAAWLRAVGEATAGGEPLALVTLLEGPRAGARLLVRAAGAEGELGDAALEGEAATLGRRVLERERAEFLSAPGGSLCAEAFGPALALVIVGAGHVGKALAALGALLGVHITVVDDRPEYASRERFPEADEIVAAPVGEALARLQIGARTAIVVAMRDHDLDYEATAAAVRSPARYVGLVGSQRKAILVAERLLAEGVPAERVRALRSPIGLDLGARTPAEIALSVLAEWVMLRQGGHGTPLRLSDELFTKAAARTAPGRVAGGAHGSEA